MGNFIEVGKVGELAEGTMKKVEANGQEILLARVGDNYYAVNDRCPHQGASLSRGKLEGSTVSCPLHVSKFDLRNGTVLRWPRVQPLTPKPLTIYNLKIEGDRILVDI